MTRTWIFQCNPQAYAIDDALRELDLIWWRAPQHTGEIGPGDRAIIWRAGENAGIVGVGVALDYPAECAPSEAERKFSLGEEALATATRVPLKVRQAGFVSKDALATNPVLGQHRIILAPMGTVFPADESQETELESLIPELKQLTVDDSGQDSEAWPAVFAWADRRRTVFPMPGGYDDYARSAIVILDYVRQAAPSRDALLEWLRSHFEVSASYSATMLRMLLSLSVLAERSGKLELTAHGVRWLESKDNAFVLALIHSRIRFIGEFLHEIITPRSADDVWRIANQRYEAGWDTRVQIDRRRGWLQSLGVLAVDADERWSLTAFGSDVLARLRVHEPPQESTRVQQAGPAKTEPHSPEQEVAASKESFEARLRSAAENTSAPDDFEKLATEAFSRLGFNSTWLGGPGRTDVLLVADLAKGHSYRVIVDCKTASRGTVPDSQIDWITLEEHRLRHEADYVVVLGVGFHGSRVSARAGERRVLLLDVETLCSLLRQHQAFPVGVDTYKRLFDASDAQGGVAAIAEVVEERSRWLRLGAAVLRAIDHLEGEEGPIVARDIYWNLRGGGEDYETYTRDEIQEVLETLSSRPIGLLARVDGGFRTLGSIETATGTLESLVRLLRSEASNGSEA